MKQQLTRWGMAVMTAIALAACGGGGSDPAPAPTPTPTPTPAPTVKELLSKAAAVASNDTATNTSAPFLTVQDAGVAAVTIASPPKVNFAVYSDGQIKTGLAITNVSFAIAKLVPGSNGEPDQWVNYIYRKETAAANVGPNNKPVLATAMQATTDGKQTDAALLAAQLVANPDGYYIYTFKTDIKDPAQTNGVVFDPTKTHRVAIQLSYKNAAGETVLVNPYFDFTIDANGKSVPVTDPSKTRKMTDVSSCNGCHEKLALHGGGRVDTQYCVMCHNPGTVDANSGNNLNLATMAHKIHAGKLLKAKLDAGKGGEDYTIWGYQNTKVGFAEVGFPQDLRNCTVCHSGANPATPQGDNWKSKVSKEACLTCHANGTGSDWEVSHKTYAGTLIGASAAAKDLSNAQCVECHKAGTNIGSDRVHWNQNEENGAKYKMNIESASYDAAARKVTVKYFLSDPTNNNAAYNLVTSECTGTGASLTCANTTKFGNLRFYLAYQNMVGQASGQTEYTSYNNGGSAANVYAYKGVNDGSNHYTVDIPLPADVKGISEAFGTARVISIGQIKEPKLQVKWATDPRPEVTPKVLVNTVVQNTFKELALTGSLQPRRTIVSSAKCNVCHGALGTTSGSNTLAEAFHGGARDTVEACVVCHDANRASNGNMMTNGLNLYEPYQFKRMIHGIHGNSKRVNPFTHGNKVVGVFNKDGSSATGGAPLAAGVENYAAEVAWPGVGINCNVCHVNNSYKQDLGPVASLVFKDTGVTDPNLWKVISPKASSCTACHDSSKAIAHVTSFGGASFGDKTQAQFAAGARETCDDCHASGGFKGVDIVHGQK
jgi:OmcA/MtrC family decaheme c-type cytochrome